MRRKGELSPAGVDRGWPHQVAVELPSGHGYGHIPSVGPLSSLCPRGHELTYNGKRYRVFCFSDPDQAARFREIMGGEVFDPRDRGRGRNWNTWYKGRGAARDARRKARGLW